MSGRQEHRRLWSSLRLVILMYIMAILVLWPTSRINVKMRITWWWPTYIRRRGENVITINGIAMLTLLVAHTWQGMKLPRVPQLPSSTLKNSTANSIYLVQHQVFALVHCKSLWWAYCFADMFSIVNIGPLLIPLSLLSVSCLGLVLAMCRAGPSPIISPLL